MNSPEPLRRAAQDLGSESADERAHARLILTRQVELITPCLAHVQDRGATEELRRQARLLLRE